MKIKLTNKLTYKPGGLNLVIIIVTFHLSLQEYILAQTPTTATNTTPKPGVGNGGNLSDTMTRGSVCKTVDLFSSLQSNHVTVETTVTSFNHDH